MPHLKGKAEMMECILERLVKNNGFILVHDGSKPTGKRLIDNPSFFCRVYRLQMDGELVNTWIRFTYDYRTGWADFKISNQDLAEFNRIMEAKENGDKGLDDEKSNTGKRARRPIRQVR